MKLVGNKKESKEERGLRIGHSQTEAHEEMGQ